MLAQVVFLALVASVAAFPGALYSQYHAQDELGQYRFGYSGPLASKHEARTADGMTRGSYSYIDANGMLQTRSYTADDVHGFRVSASDVPVVAGAVAATLPEAVQGRVDVGATPVLGTSPRYVWQLAAPARHYVHTPVTYRRQNFPRQQNYIRATPYYTPEETGVFAVDGALRGLHGGGLHGFLPHGISSQYHAQDEAGQYSFGYSNDISTKSETKTSDGVTRGSFSYLDPNGVIQTRSYVADENGFRVVASDLPRAPINP